MRNFGRFRDENAERINQERVKKQLKSLVRQGYKQGYINISNRNLTEIPDYVFNPDEVFETENINYDFNRNTDNDDWWEISELKKLNIANNQIEVISPLIGKMDTLVHLNFCDNKLDSLPEEIQKLQLVTSIHLERNNFSIIPMPLFELENLVELFLFNNRLVGDLSKYEFYKLSNLEVLDLSENFIDNVGDCFSKNKKLRKLQLSHNRIREINSLDLKHCKELELSNNELVSIFTEEQSFPMLQRLDLRNNKLQCIGDHVSCPELKELYLTSNRLSSLGSIVKSSSHLNILDIYGNVFKEVPKEILNLKEITRLDLGNNDIIELPPKLGLLSTIKFLRFEGNRIKGIKVNKTSEVLKLLKNRIPTDELQEFQEDLSDPFSVKVQINTSNNRNQNINSNLSNSSFDHSQKPPSPKKTNMSPYHNSTYQSVNQRRGYNILQSSFSTDPFGSPDQPTTSNNYSTRNGYKNNNNNNYNQQSVDPFGSNNSRRNFNNHNQSSELSDPFGNSNRPTSVHNNNSYSRSIQSKTGNSNNTNSQEPSPSSLKKTEISISSQNINTRTLEIISKELTSLDKSDLEAVPFAAETINLSKNLFTSVPSSIALYASSLTSLTIDFNRITVFPEQLSLPNLVHLSMAHNSISEFPENTDTFQFPRLLELNLSYNNIKKLPSDRIPFPALQTLILSKNRIESIDHPEIFGQLYALDLSDNSISYIPPKLGLCSRLQRLELEGNTFRIPRYQILQKGTAAILAYLKDRIPQN